MKHYLDLFEKVILSIIIAGTVSSLAFGLSKTHFGEMTENQCVTDTKYCYPDYQYSTDLHDVVFSKEVYHMGGCLTLEARFSGKDSERSKVTYCGMEDFSDIQLVGLKFNAIRQYGDMVRRDFRLPYYSKYLYCIVTTVKLPEKPKEEQQETQQDSIIPFTDKEQETVKNSMFCQSVPFGI